MVLRRRAADWLIVVVALTGLLTSCGDEKSACNLDARTGPNGETYGRDPDQGCKFVDENGKVLPDQ